MNSQEERSAQYLDFYRDNIKRISENSSPLINSFREPAIENFTRLGIPTRKNESYRYTNLDTFFGHDFKSYFIFNLGHSSDILEFNSRFFNRNMSVYIG